jgi:spore maturation protein CgeB
MRAFPNFREAAAHFLCPSIPQKPLFGRDCYEALSTARIVLNGAIDIAGPDRGNMRCFEALGAGSLLLSDQGNDRDGMRDGETIVTYNSPEQAVNQIETRLEDSRRRPRIGCAGHEMVSTRYSKEVQWKRFEALAASV